MLAIVAIGSDEAVSEDAAFERAAKSPFDMGRRCFTVLAACEFQPGFEAGLDNGFRGGSGQCATTAFARDGGVDNAGVWARGALSGGCHRVGPSWSGNRDRKLNIDTVIGRRSTAAAIDSARLAGDAAQPKFRPTKSGAPRQPAFAGK